MVEQATGAVVWTVCIPSLEDLGRQMLIYTTWHWLSSSPSVGHGWHEQIWRWRPQSSIWKYLSISWISQVRSHKGKTRLKTVVWFLGHTGFQEYGYLWWCPRPAVTFLHQIFKACDDTTPPCHCSVPGSAGGTPNRHSSSRHPGDDGGFNSSFPMKDSNCLLSYFSIICASSLIRHFTLATFCSVSMVIGWPQQSLSSNVVFAELNFLVPHVNCRSQWKMVPRAVWQTLEALLEKLPLVTVTMHHCTKISPWTCLRCWGKPSLQTFCRLEQVWPIRTECFFVCSITKKTLLPVLM